MSSPKKRSALVTGGSRGIGWGIVSLLLEHNFHVIVADVNQPQSSLNDSLSFIQADISVLVDREKIMELCKGKADCLDLLVNNAGISVKERKDMLEGDEDSLDHLLNVNLKGPYFLTQSVAKWMIAQKAAPDYNPKIINIASLTSYASATFLAEYALSKSAVSMMTKLYADRLSEYGINVYEIRPGIIKTDMTQPSQKKYDDFIDSGGLPLKRWGMPDDVAKTVVAIANDYLPYSTGEVINVDGGFHLRRL